LQAVYPHVPKAWSGNSSAENKQARLLFLHARLGVIGQGLRMGTAAAKDMPDTTDGRELKGAIMRARLRAATEALIAEVGVEAASAAAIALKCGVSRGAMLHHYPTRDALIIDTAAHFWQRSQEVVAGLAEDVRHGRTDVSTFVGRLYEEVFRANALVTMLDLMVSGRSASRIGEAVNRILTDLFASYESLGAQAFQASGLPPERVHVIITLIVSTLRGLRIQDNIHPDEARVRAVLAALVEAVEALLQNSNPTIASSSQRAGKRTDMATRSRKR
jgi:AcrR family transcriptional regulator